MKIHIYFSSAKITCCFLSFFLFVNFNAFASQGGGQPYHWDSLTILLTLMKMKINARAKSSDHRLENAEATKKFLCTLSPQDFDSILNEHGLNFDEAQIGSFYAKLHQLSGQSPSSSSNHWSSSSSSAPSHAAASSGGGCKSNIVVSKSVTVSEEGLGLDAAKASATVSALKPKSPTPTPAACSESGEDTIDVFNSRESQLDSRESQLDSRESQLDSRKPASRSASFPLNTIFSGSSSTRSASTHPGASNVAKDLINEAAAAQASTASLLQKDSPIQPSKRSTRKRATVSKLPKFNRASFLQKLSPTQLGGLALFKIQLNHCSEEWKQAYYNKAVRMFNELDPGKNYVYTEPTTIQKVIDLRTKDYLSPEELDTLLKSASLSEVQLVEKAFSKHPKAMEGLLKRKGFIMKKFLFDVSSIISSSSSSTELTAVPTAEVIPKSPSVSPKKDYRNIIKMMAQLGLRKTKVTNEEIVNFFEENSIDTLATSFNMSDQDKNGILDELSQYKSVAVAPATLSSLPASSSSSSSSSSFGAPHSDNISTPSTTNPAKYSSEFQLRQERASSTPPLPLSNSNSSESPKPSESLIAYPKKAHPTGRKATTEKRPPTIRKFKSSSPSKEFNDQNAIISKVAVVPVSLSASPSSSSSSSPSRKFNDQNVIISKVAVAGAVGMVCASGIILSQLYRKKLTFGELDPRKVRTTVPKIGHIFCEDLGWSLDKISERIPSFLKGKKATATEERDSNQSKHVIASAIAS